MILQILFQIITLLGLSLCYFTEQVMASSILECSIFIIWILGFFALDNKYANLWSVVFISMYTIYYYDSGNVYYN